MGFVLIIGALYLRFTLLISPCLHLGCPRSNTSCTTWCPKLWRQSSKASEGSSSILEISLGTVWELCPWDLKTTSESIGGEKNMTRNRRNKGWHPRSHNKQTPCALSTSKDLTYSHCDESHWLYWLKHLSRGCLELCHVHITQQYHAARNSHMGTNHFCKSLLKVAHLCVEPSEVQCSNKRHKMRQPKRWRANLYTSQTLKEKTWNKNLIQQNSKQSPYMSCL